MARPNPGLVNAQSLLATPLGLVNGIITSPVWIAFFTRFVFPILTAAAQSDLSVTDLLEAGRTGVQADESSDLQLMGAFPAVPEPVAEFPPVARSQQYATELAMLAAVKTSAQGIPWVLADTHANRSKYSNSAYLVGTFYIETDRLTVFRNSGTTWVYVDGTYTDTLSNIPTLGTDDAGFLFSVSDYGHLLRWSGSAWAWGPGESGSGYFQDFAVAPTGSGWHVCDGSAGVAYLKADGTTGTVDLPDTNGSAAYRKNGSSYASSITAGAAPSIPASATTATAPAVNGTTDVDGGAGQVVQSGTGVTVAAHTHTHTQGSLAAASHTHGYGGINTSLAGGDPIAHYQAITYFRQ